MTKPTGWKCDCDPAKHPCKEVEALRAWALKLEDTLVRMSLAITFHDIGVGAAEDVTSAAKEVTELGRQIMAVQADHCPTCAMTDPIIRAEVERLKAENAALRARMMIAAEGIAHAAGMLRACYTGDPFPAGGQARSSAHQIEQIAEALRND